jgi:hypothetical protein
MKIRLLIIFLLYTSASILSAQVETKEKSLDIYGFVMTDACYNFGQTDAAWFEVLITSNSLIHFIRNHINYFSLRKNIHKQNTV